MRKALLLLSALFWMVRVSQAHDEQPPTLIIYPADVVQASVQQLRAGTNIIVRWAYNEAGAQKMLDFWEKHAGRQVCIRIGAFTSPTILRSSQGSAGYAEWKQGWLKARTDKFFGVSADDAKAIIVGLMKE